MKKAKQQDFYDGANFQVERSIGYLIRQIINNAAVVTEQRMAEHGITDAQWKPLLMLQQGLCTTAAEASRLMCCDTGAMTRMLNRVEAKGLVQRTRSNEDKRVVKLELTEEGKQTVEVVPYVLADIWNTLLEEFNKEEIEQMIGFLQRLFVNARSLREGVSEQSIENENS